MTEHPCPHCGAPLPEGASFCPHCAKEVEERKPARKAIPLRRKILLALLVLVVVAAGVIGWRLADQPEVYDGQGVVTYGNYQLVLSYSGARATPQPERYQKSAPGEQYRFPSLLFINDAIGVYIGDGLAVECTPSWDNKVQITACNCSKSGYNRRNWTKHGKLPYIEYDVQETTTSPEPEKPSTDVQGAFKVGDIVEFKGYKHYSTANASKGSSVKPCRAKVTQVYKTGKHPYHVRAVNSLGVFTSGVYGWVDAADLAPIGEIKAGDKVKVLNAVTYTGQKFKTYYDEYDVIQVNGDRAVIGIGKTVTAAINIKNIQLV